ncbi:8113_t:CDS:2 [Paraglomus occultum]|uniref:8113_t:CDS:1 n=1 Tax=Paraglomus occultum TaxID=144539 RepID=A0A9N9B5X8_9GLOM|nr:8113_t:CDS:2 [Paraglomus occultum]
MSDSSNTPSISDRSSTADTINSQNLSNTSLEELVPLADERTLKVVTRANQYFENKNYRAALDEYTKALTLSQPNLNPLESSDFSALLFSKRSATYYCCQLYKDAEKDAAQVIRIRPGWAEGYFRRAEALLDMGKYDEAMDDYERARTKDPKNPRIPLKIAKVMILKDNIGMGRDICVNRNALVTPVQAKIFDCAIEMKNIIYIVADTETRKCVVIDACWDVDGIARFINQHSFTLTGAILTHYHFDHVGGYPPPPYDYIPIRVPGLYTLLKRYPEIRAYVHPQDLPYILEANPSLSSYESRIVHTHSHYILQLGASTLLRFMHTPGHTPGSQVILVNQTRLFTGDTLMVGSFGRIDLPGGDMNEMNKTLNERLARFEDGIVVYPGHDYDGDWTTIGMERAKGIVGKIVL